MSIKDISIITVIHYFLFCYSIIFTFLSGITDLQRYTLYSSCEPCPMCMSAVIWANVGRVVYSVTAKQAAEKIGSMFELSSEGLTTHSTNKPKLIGPLLQDEGIRVFE